MGARVGVERTGFVVAARGVEVGELLGLGNELAHLVAHVQAVLLGTGGDQVGHVARGHLLARVRDGEGGTNAIAHHAWLAGGEVAAGSSLHDQVAADAGADVLDLADDAQAVIGQQVELGHFRTVVGDLEHQVAAGRRCSAHLTGIVGAAHLDVAAC